MRSIPPGTRSFTDDGTPAAWSAERGLIRFRDGHEIDLHSEQAYIRFDPSAQFFLLAKSTNVTEIRRVNPFNLPVATVPFDARWLFASTEHLYVFGKKSDPEKPDTLLCRILARRDGAYVTREDIEIPRAVRRWTLDVEDFDTVSETVLLREGDDLRDDFWLFRLTTHRRSILGRAEGSGFFLEDDIIAKTLGSPVQGKR